MDPLDVLPEAVLVLDADRRLRHANDRATALLGVGARLGTPLADVVTLADEDGRVCSDPLPSPLPGGRIAEQLLRVVLPDGRHRPVAMAGRWLDDGGVVLSFRSAGRREAVDEARSDVVAMVAHELRSPLVSVRGFSRVLRARWAELPDPQRDTMLAAIDADADRVTRLLAELLQVARIDVGRVQLRTTPVDVAEVARGVVARAVHQPEAAGRSLDVEVADGAAHRVVADPDKVVQMLTNLVDNALRHAPGADVALRVDGDGDGVTVAVVDTGPGIEGDQLATVFRKFGRGRHVRRSGTGLGLYITRGLARAHGGDVVVSSTPGEGSTFTLRLPRRPG